MHIQAQRFFFNYVKSTRNNLIGDSRQSEIHIVFDNYENLSIKDPTRKARSMDSEKMAYHIQMDGKVPVKWIQFLGSSENRKEKKRKKNWQNVFPVSSVTLIPLS